MSIFVASLSQEGYYFNVVNLVPVMTIKKQPEEYIISALNEIPEALDYIMMLAQKCNGDAEALDLEIYNWLEKTWCHGYFSEEQIQASLDRLPKPPLSEKEVERVSRYEFLSELLKYLLEEVDSHALGEYYSKKYHDFRREWHPECLRLNMTLPDPSGADPFGVS